MSFIIFVKLSQLVSKLTLAETVLQKSWSSTFTEEVSKQEKTLDLCAMASAYLELLHLASCYVSSCMYNASPILKHHIWTNKSVKTKHFFFGWGKCHFALPKTCWSFLAYLILCGPKLFQFQSWRLKGQWKFEEKNPY